MAAERAIDPVTPRQVALVTAAFVGIVAGALGVVQVVGSAGRFGWWWPPVYVVVVFLTVYLIMGVALERFITARLRVLFRMVHDLKTGPGSAPAVDTDRDVLGQVESTMEDWVRAKGTEITELKQREAFRREFIGNLAHELKTPLHNMQGYLETLLDGGLEDPKVNRDFLQRAARSTDRLIKIVEDLDMIAKLESGVLELRMRPLDLAALVRDEMTDAARQASVKGIQLVNELPDDLRVQADPGRLEQVFTNLIDNAIHYGRPGGRVVVRAIDLEGGQVLVEVSDNGIGIAAQHLPRLFERFYRVDKSRARKEGGSGLGLAIVKHIVEAHGQSITAKSAEGEGTTFAFTLAKAR